ncbi:AAA-ATPase ASD, mitochondrial [Artemisia annua]|uniref:AAA-ATPase ASD, mitochondrial n=1 Tax=Artemisia annua TaxID=35608 RepID=A0A2U1LCB0_ARTAN|nr:AAA-ATPase ASD, mitochondrial [Artemisia annua]
MSLKEPRSISLQGKLHQHNKGDELNFDGSGVNTLNFFDAHGSESPNDEEGDPSNEEGSGRVSSDDNSNSVNEEDAATATQIDDTITSEGISQNVLNGEDHGEAPPSLRRSSRHRSQPVRFNDFVVVLTSSMIAAMANLLEYDIYGLEQNLAKNTTELWTLLIQTSSKSLIVLEEICCSLDLTGKRNEEKVNKWAYKDIIGKKDNKKKRSEMTVSRLLNSVGDGLCPASACGSRKIIVFATNHFEKLDYLTKRWVRIEMS